MYEARATSRAGHPPGSETTLTIRGRRMFSEMPFQIILTTEADAARN